MKYNAPKWIEATNRRTSYKKHYHFRKTNIFTKLNPDTFIILLFFITAIALALEDSISIIKPQKAWAISNRFVETDLALTSFLAKAGASNISSNIIKLPDIKIEQISAVGGRISEYDIIKTIKSTNDLPAYNPVKHELESISNNRNEQIHITSPYGYRNFGGRIRHHDGIDISLPYGAPIKAYEDGVVSYADWKSGYGKLIIIDHGYGKQSYYAHASRISVLPGQKVSKGDIIGYVGNTGRSYGVHLHFEIRYNNIPVNPEEEFISSRLYS